GRGGAPDDGDGGPPEGLRPAERPGSRDGQVPRVRVRQGGRGGLLPHPRRLRLLQGVRDRAAVPGGADAADRRGHRGDPEDDHRASAAGGIPDPRLAGSRGPTITWPRLPAGGTWHNTRCGLATRPALAPADPPRAVRYHRP